MERRRALRDAASRAAAVLLAVAAAASGPAPPALAQTTGLVVDVDATVTLGCLDPLAFDITAADLSAALTGGVPSNSSVRLSTGSLSTSFAGGALSVQLPIINQPLSGDIRSYDLTEVGCVIQASPSFGQVRVRMGLTGNTTLLGPAGSRITINSVRGRRFGTSGGFATSYTYPAWIHFFTETYIEFRINVDLSQANAAGLHANATGGSFIVEVTAP